MKTVNEWLQHVKARDVMTKSVAFLRPTDPLSDAVSLLLRDQISGAPVVDDDGVCVGVLSATDILNFEERRSDLPVTAGMTRHRCFDTWDPGSEWWREFGGVRTELQPRLDENVAGFMTRDLVSVTEDTPMGVVIRQMVDAHVHRVLVLDSGRKLKGIISTMDVLSGLLRAGHPRH